MNDKTGVIQIKPAKGRPMLTWVGKRPLRNVIAYPAQLIETYGTANKTRETRLDLWQDWPADYPKGGLLFHGDNKDVLAHLLANGFRGKVNLIYIDPPFDSGADYIRKVVLRGLSGSSRINGEDYSLGEQIQYTDIWANDNYLQFIYERLLLVKELLSDDGSIIIHCDYRRAHYLKIILDEIFGEENLQANIVWRSMTPSGFKGKSSIGRSHADLLYYSKSNNFTYNSIYKPYDKEYLERFNKHDPDGRRFKDEKIGTATTQDTINKLKSEGRIFTTSKGTIRIKSYLNEAPGLMIDDVWTDIYGENSQSSDLTDYPTQKPSELLERIIRLLSNPFDLVLDCFIGSGTTAVIAQKLGRRWIGCDINKGAIQSTFKRLQTIIDEQSVFTIQSSLPELGDKVETKNSQIPAQLSFYVYRVNDYDLQIQHNEAINLACMHIGVTRTKTDAFFDGTLGKRLVKITPFNHPLTLLDLEEIKKELANRPEEERDIVVACLGKELSVEAWLEDWNRLRKQKDFPNKIEVIELRSDPRYGGFFTHKPAQADIKIQRAENGIDVTIESFISPTIVERLKQQAGILSPQIDDWRAMVDSVMIDTAYDGQVFNVVLADVPEKKSDLVSGGYSLPATKGETIVAVKITDMLGEEVLIAQKV